MGIMITLKKPTPERGPAPHRRAHVVLDLRLGQRPGIEPDVIQAALERLLETAVDAKA
jgi:hypothetical protein